MIANSESLGLPGFVTKYNGKPVLINRSGNCESIFFIYSSVALINYVRKHENIFGIYMQLLLTALQCVTLWRNLFRTNFTLVFRDNLLGVCTGLMLL